jgi:hypothetical protein
MRTDQPALNGSRGRLTFAGTLRPGDAVLQSDTYLVITKVRRAQGRKPKVGENLHLVTDRGDLVRLNSTEPVRVRRAPAS